ncbi:MAG: PD-(D/E)XK nuclease family protein [Deltaproteobacteria bacterium]|nr:PD-(D/E)XK nuclease family protein [Deltaproteobacteria bacterium]
MNKQISTYTMWSTFLHCERRAYWRYIREMVPVRLDDALTFGSLIHECLASWYKDGSSESVLALIDDNYTERHYDATARKHWHYARAMMLAYMNRYVLDNWGVVAIEHEFDQPLKNPATGWGSHTFRLCGKIDLAVMVNDRAYVVEHKTAATIDAAYIEGLNLSLQADIYSNVAGDSPVGVIYNLLKKPAIRQFEANQRRKEPETDEAFQARLAEKLSEPDAFQRFTFLYDMNDRRRLQAELWELTNRWRRCTRSGMWLQDRQACFRFNKPCSYFKLCSSRDSEDVLNEFYEHKAAHSELTQEDTPHATT